jgi:hypothetical protein
MNRILLKFLIVLMILIIPGCVEQTEPVPKMLYVCQSGETVNEPSLCPAVTSPPPDTGRPTTTTTSTTSTSTTTTLSPPLTVLPTSSPPTTPPSQTVSEKDPCPPSEENPIKHGSPIVSDVYICNVIFPNEDDWQVVLYNQGDEDIILDHYKLKDYDNKFYSFPYQGDTAIQAGGYWTVNGTNDYESLRFRDGLLLRSWRDTLWLEAYGEILDRVDWNQIE